MASILTLIISALSAYIIGSFPTSFILTKVLKGVDIRQAGSKNVGATNVLRVVGRLPALIALIADVLKGVLVVTLVTNFFHSNLTRDLDYIFFRALLGFVAICGHIWPVFLGFKGGKGVATAIGVLIVIAPRTLCFSILAWFIVFVTTNYVSLASIVLAVSLPVVASLLKSPLSVIIFATAICMLIIYRHKENIRRLLKGEENKTVIFEKR